MSTIEQDYIEQMRTQWADEYGYEAFTVLPNGRTAVVARMAFTYAILVDLSMWAYEDRWCFENRDKAIKALAAWDGEGEPQGWHRHPGTGRRRPDGDAAQEYVAL